MDSLKLIGVCPNMNKAASGYSVILIDLEQANYYVKTINITKSLILVTSQIDWTWTRVLEHFKGVITDHGTRVSRAAEVLALMTLPGALGTENATKVLRSGDQVQIVCKGNKTHVYVSSEC
ncbi:MAG: PEP-utilizing enzyme [Promethearchaeota archaeon]